VSERRKMNVAKNTMGKRESANMVSIGPQWVRQRVQHIEKKIQRTRERERERKRERERGRRNMPTSL